MDESVCGRCGAALDGKSCRVPPGLAWPAIFAFAFLHAGMWAHDAFRRPFCARCRALACAAALVCAGVIFAIVSGGILLLFRRRH